VQRTEQGLYASLAGELLPDPIEDPLKCRYLETKNDMQLYICETKEDENKPAEIIYEDDAENTR
jgi:hypothetical protein